MPNDLRRLSVRRLSKGFQESKDRSLRQRLQGVVQELPQAAIFAFYRSVHEQSDQDDDRDRYAKKEQQ
jgi:hypothetical protein